MPLCQQRPHKHYLLECSVHFVVEKMPYSIPPKFMSSGSRKVNSSQFAYRLISLSCALLQTSRSWLVRLLQVAVAVTWKRTDSLFFVPVWIIILAVLAGLLLLALLIYLLYKVKHQLLMDEWVLNDPETHRRPDLNQTRKNVGHVPLMLTIDVANYILQIKLHYKSNQWR